MLDTNAPAVDCRFWVFNSALAQCIRHDWAVLCSDYNPKETVSLLFIIQIDIGLLSHNSYKWSYTQVAPVRLFLLLNGDCCCAISMMYSFIYRRRWARWAEGLQWKWLCNMCVAGKKQKKNSRATFISLLNVVFTTGEAGAQAVERVV